MSGSNHRALLNKAKFEFLNLSLAILQIDEPVEIHGNVICPRRDPEIAVVKRFDRLRDTLSKLEREALLEVAVKPPYRAYAFRHEQGSSPRPSGGTLLLLGSDPGRSPRVS